MIPPRSVLTLVIAVAIAAAGEPIVTIDYTAPGTPCSSLLYGVFYEEINRAGEGGLHAEMLQNRDFGEDGNTATSWIPIGKAELSIDRTLPLNPKNTSSLRLTLSAKGDGVANAGFGFRAVGEGKPPQEAYGLHVRSGASYALKLYVRGSQAHLEARLEGRDGKTLCRRPLPEATGAWNRVEVDLIPDSDHDNARLSLVAAEPLDAPATVWLDHVSLLPHETWNGIGLRKDLAEMVAAMRPSFVRFPGGSYIEGLSVKDALRWKNTIGAQEERPYHNGFWGYRTTNVLGLHEMLVWCEALGAEPVYAINCGMTHGGRVPMGDMEPFVQDALDLIEYANGPISSIWGAKRAQAGHPEPFNLKYIQIGNENGGEEYAKRYALFHDAIARKYPHVTIIACDWGGVPSSRPIRMRDQHYYGNAESFYRNVHLFDAAARNGQTIFVGEYAVTKGCGRGNLRAAIAEAAFMIGMERNSDIVAMSCYAPLLADPLWQKWNPCAILFDNKMAYGTPSYHLQALFSQHRLARLQPVQVQNETTPYRAPMGTISLGTWKTAAEFRDVMFTQPDGTVAYSSATDGGADGSSWTYLSGTWHSRDGVLAQTDPSAQGARCILAGKQWGNGVLSLKAKRNLGDEGFIIGFQLSGSESGGTWNIGGWNNTEHGFQLQYASSPRVKGSIRDAKWYDIRLEFQDRFVRGYLDGVLVQEFHYPDRQTLFAVAGRDAGGSPIVKCVNASETPTKIEFRLNGLPGAPTKVQAWILGGQELDDENSFQDPRHIAPISSAHSLDRSILRMDMPRNSILVLAGMPGK